MAAQLHPHWGQVKDDYDNTYVYDSRAAKQKVVLSQGVMQELHTRGTETIDKLRVLGESPHEPNWDDAPNRITLPMLRSLVQYMVFHCSLSKLGNPLVVRGCIKLMKSISRFGRCSPFSYEYGHLCFRILLVAFDYCVLRLSSSHECWMTETTQPENQLLKEGVAPRLSQAVSKVIDECLVKDNVEYYSKFIVLLPWTDAYTGPLVRPHDIRVLTQILEGDRKHFLIFIRSNYSLRPSALLYTMFQVMHRTPPTSENRPFVQGFLHVYTRTLLLAPGDAFRRGWQHQYLMHLLEEYESIRQPLDAEDSKLVLRAYTDRLTVLSDDSSLHPRATSTLAVELLQFVLPLISDGSEALIPPTIRATLRSMWEDWGDDHSRVTPAVVKACTQLMEHIKRLFDLLVERIEVTRGPIMKQAVDVIFDENLVGLFVTILSHICPNDESVLDDDSPAAPLFDALDGIFTSLKGAVPIADVERKI
ncbi:hypothetical protein FRC11_006140, partial [Ceratobasidium sp. 423]